MRYSDERKEAILKKLFPPNNRTVADVAEEEGISPATLYKWRREARAQGCLLPDGANGPKGWSSRDKFTAVLEASSLSEAELAEYCRKRGLYPEQVKAWRRACEKANAWEEAQARRLKESVREDKKRIKGLERALREKEKALAETAALLVLRKKAEAIWGEPEGE